MRRLVSCWLATATLVGAAVAACDGDDKADGTGPDAASDAAALGETDASPIDSGSDAGPNVSEALGTTGVVRVFPDGVQGFFLIDDTILRVSNAPECVAHLSGVGKEDAKAGGITVGGAIVGADGGPSQPIEVTADSDNAYFYGGQVFPPDPLLTIQVAIAGFGSVSAMPVQTLHPPGEVPLEITAPVPTIIDAGQPPPPPPLDGGEIPPPPDGGAPSTGAVLRTLEISSAVPLEIKWRVPSGTSNPRVVVTYRDVSGLVAGKQAQLYCDYPVAQGTAVIPPNLLTEIRRRVGENARGQLTVWAGDRKVYTAASQAGAVSYIIDVTRPTSTTLHPDGAYIEAELK